MNRRKYDDINHAHERIDTHEALCTERHKVINDKVDVTQKSQWRTEKMLWGWHVGWVVFLFLASQGYVDLSSLVKKHPQENGAQAAELIK